MQLATAHWNASLIHTVTTLGIPDLLKDGAKSADDLAKSTNSNPGALYRVLRAVAGFNIVEEVDFDKHVFKLGPLGELLTTDHPRSMKNAALLMGHPTHVLPWVDLRYAVEHGTDALKKNFNGKDFWQITDEDPHLLQIFDGAMSELSRNNHALVVDAYDFAGIKKLTDVGGGRGALLNAILTKHQDLEGVVFDRPQVVADEAKYPKSEQVRSRLSFVGGDFFVSVPESDAYIMSMILHDWSDENSLKILQTIHKAAPEGARLLVVDCVVPKDNSVSMSKLMDVHMMVIPGGKERTEEEFSELFAKAGFRLTRVVPTKTWASVVEGVKI